MVRSGTWICKGQELIYIEENFPNLYTQYMINPYHEAIYTAESQSKTNIICIGLHEIQPLQSKGIRRGSVIPNYILSHWTTGEQRRKTVVLVSNT